MSHRPKERSNEAQPLGNDAQPLQSIGIVLGDDNEEEEAGAGLAPLMSAWSRAKRDTCASPCLFINCQSLLVG